MRAFINQENIHECILTFTLMFFYSFIHLSLIFLFYFLSNLSEIFFLKASLQHLKHPIPYEITGVREQTPLLSCQDGAGAEPCSTGKEPGRFRSMCSNESGPLPNLVCPCQVPSLHFKSWSSSLNFTSAYILFH